MILLLKMFVLVKSARLEEKMQPIKTKIKKFKKQTKYVHKRSEGLRGRRGTK